MILDPKWIRLASVMSAAVMVKGTLIFGGLWLGTVVDRELSTSPLFTILLLVVGTTLGLWWLIFVAKRAGR